MFKTITLLKRKPGMSFDDFVAYYEGTHSKLGDKYVPTRAHYSRLYLRPMADPITGETPETDYDVVTELWFETRAAFDKAMVRLSDPAVLAEIHEDEARLFDTSKIQMFVVEEYVSDPVPS